MVNENKIIAKEEGGVDHKAWLETHQKIKNNKYIEDCYIVENKDMGKLVITQEQVKPELLEMLFENSFLCGMIVNRGTNLSKLPISIKEACSYFLANNFRIFVKIISAPPEWIKESEYKCCSYHHLEIKTNEVSLLDLTCQKENLIIDKKINEEPRLINEELRVKALIKIYSILKNQDNNIKTIQSDSRIII